MGMYAYGFAIAGFVYSATTLGIDEYGIREYARRAAERRAGLLADLLGSQTCIAVVASIALAAYLFVTSPTAEALTIVLALTTYQLCSAFASTLFVPAMAEQHMLWPALVILLCRALGLAIAAPLILIAHAPLHIATLAVGVSGVLTVLLAAASARSHVSTLRLHISLTVLRQNVRTLWRGKFDSRPFAPKINAGSRCDSVRRVSATDACSNFKKNKLLVLMWRRV